MTLVLAFCNVLLFF